METNNRKPNRLKNFDYAQTGCYFVTLCTQNRQHLFEMENTVTSDNLCIIPPISNQIIHKWIKATENKFKTIKFEKYVIMPDHLHFIIKISERHTGRSIPDVMKFFKTMTTNEYIHNVKNNILPPFNKKLWQKSYYDHIIRNHNDYNEIWEYIDNNPKKRILLNEPQD